MKKMLMLAVLAMIAVSVPVCVFAGCFTCVETAGAFSGGQLSGSVWANQGFSLNNFSGYESFSAFTNTAGSLNTSSWSSAYEPMNFYSPYFGYAMGSNTTSANFGVSQVLDLGPVKMSSWFNGSSVSSTGVFK